MYSSANSSVFRPQKRFSTWCKPMFHSQTVQSLHFSKPLRLTELCLKSPEARYSPVQVVWLQPPYLLHWLFCFQTERTMTELEIAVNQRVGEWEVIQESGTTLRPLFGPGLTGMKNLGNSCYLNSVMQVLFTIPDFQSKSVTSFFFFFFLSLKQSPSSCVQHVISYSKLK